MVRLARLLLKNKISPLRCASVEMTILESCRNDKRDVIPSAVEESITAQKDFSTTVLRTFARNDKVLPSGRVVEMTK